MGYALRIRECAGCGKPIKGHLPPTKPVRCIECAITRAYQAAVGMAHKQGEFYAKWQQSRGPQGRPRKG